MPKSLKPTVSKLTPSVKRFLSQIAARYPTKSAPWLTKKLEERFGGRFSEAGVSKCLRVDGFRHPGQCRPKLSSFTAEIERDRLARAKANAKTDWKRIWSFNEGYFALPDGVFGAWYEKEAYDQATPPFIPEYRACTKIGIAVAVSHNRKSALCFLPTPWRSNDLIEIMNEQLLPSIQWDPNQRRCRAMMMSNDGRHHNRRFEAFLSQKSSSKKTVLVFNQKTAPISIQSTIFSLP